MDRAMGAGSTARDTLLGEAERIALSDGAQIPLRQDVTRELIDPQVRGLVTALWSPYLIPSRNDWSRVTMGRP